MSETEVRFFALNKKGRLNESYWVWVLALVRVPVRVLVSAAGNSN